MYRPGGRLVLDLHAVSDLRRPLRGAVAEAVLRGPGGTRNWRFAGEIPADSCVRIGRIDHIWPPSAPAGPLRIELALRWDGGQVTNTYTSELAADSAPEKRKRSGRMRRVAPPAGG
jgi:hypothetical protein